MKFLYIQPKIYLDFKNLMVNAFIYSNWNIYYE